jgi:hypothetical protein
VNDPLNDNRYLSGYWASVVAAFERRLEALDDLIGRQNIRIEDLEVGRSADSASMQRQALEIRRLRALAQRALALADDTPPRDGMDAWLAERSAIEQALG